MTARLGSETSAPSRRARYAYITAVVLSSCKLTIPGRRRFEQLQAREAWETTGTRVDRWRQLAATFRSERLTALQNDQSFVPLAPGPKVVLHCIPLESFGTDASHDVFALSGVYPMGWTRLHAWLQRINIEGSICLDAGEPPSAYTQIYRSGAVEAVRANLLRIPHPRNPAPDVILSQLYEEAVVQYVPHCFGLMRRIGCTPPVLIGISLIGVRGLTMADSSGAVIDRDVLALPDVIVEDFSAKPSALLKPSLDRVWNACGSPGSPYFDASGNWVGQRSLI